MAYAVKESKKAANIAMWHSLRQHGAMMAATVADVEQALRAQF